MINRALPHAGGSALAGIANHVDALIHQEAVQIC